MDNELITEIEQVFLGILMRHPERYLDVRGFFNPEAFSDCLHERMFNIIRECQRDGYVSDELIVISKLEPIYFNDDEQEKREYVLACGSSANNPSVCQGYGKAIMDAWRGRRIAEIQKTIKDPIEQAKRISEVSREADVESVADGVVTIGDAMEQTLERIDAVYRNGSGFIGLRSGISDLDKKLCGLENSGLYVLAGRPAMGKSMVGLSIAVNAAMKDNPVLFFSLEMSAEQIIHRINSRFTNNTIWKQKTGQGVDFVELAKAKQNYGKMPLTIIDKGGVTAEWICAKSSELARKQKPDLIVIDHLAIVAALDPRAPRVQQVTEMTATFKALAKDLECPVILLHQLNRGVEGREDKRPTLSDLRDSGSVEQDADAVIMIYREEYYLQNKSEDDKNWSKTQERLSKVQGIAELIIAKNRQGETGIVRVKFDPVKQVVSDLAKGWIE